MMRMKTFQSEIAQKVRDHGCDEIGAMLCVNIAIKSEASVADIVSQVLNLNAEGSNDKEDNECEVETHENLQTFSRL